MQNKLIEMQFEMASFTDVDDIFFVIYDWQVLLILLLNFIKDKVAVQFVSY